MIDTKNIRTQLESRLKELSERAKIIDKDLSQPADDDWEEAAVESAGDETLEELGELALQEMQDIKFALARIDAGKYGMCATCGEDISAGRLEAVPYATNCINCS